MASVRPAAAAPRSRTAPAAAPTPYAPARHPGNPGRWNRDSVLESLRQWAVETGRPPRRQDWTGERPQDARQAQRKWMREHPRWPSSSCVAAHFGTWSKALQAASLPARCLTFEDSVSERVDAAWRLAADGHTLRAIAQELGVSVSSVNNYLRAHACPDCGGPVTSPRASRCRTCTANEPTTPSAWSRESVRRAISEWQTENGQPPRYHEWTPSRATPGRWEADSPRWPSAAVVCDLYADHADPWNAALADAGAQVRFRRWSDDAIRASLAGFWARTARPPVAADLLDEAWQGPTGPTIKRRYGSIERAWDVLGPVPAAPGMHATTSCPEL
ncbi:MAG TPA: helix-turn-helix domain-containing protein [Solirubrobacteraceae bacterium]